MNNLKATIAKNLKDARERLQLTQSELAKKAGINGNTYAKIERSGGLKLETLKKLAKALGVTSTDILGF